ncbi:MAG: YdiU family protein [Myxococcota bacterium]
MSAAKIAFEHSYAELPEGFFADVQPETAPAPQLIKVNAALAEELGLDAAWLESPEGVAMLSGNDVPESAKPIAMAYAGHQFGGWSPQLGDGRALLLGELLPGDGVRRDLQLKGSGRTPYSRQGDGKAPLGPVIREYLVSEAMAALGVPTTRALAAVQTGETVYREGPLPGAVLARVASSHVRVGTFQYFYAKGETDSLRKLADYIIDRHYPEAKAAANPYRALIENVAKRQARLITRWMHLGFIHGVMNTDNMQIAGETIDFGPCAFMEAFDAGTVLSSIDRQGRYAWGNQPQIGQWNITRLAESLLPILADDKDAATKEAEAAVNVFGEVFNAEFVPGFCAKMGLNAEKESAEPFVLETFELLTREKVDFTRFFRELTRVAGGAEADSLIELFDAPAVGQDWVGRWRNEASEGAGIPPARVDAMRGMNPVFIPRNHRVEEAIQAALQGDYSVFERLNQVWSRPFEEQPEHAELEMPATPEEEIRQTFCGT